MDIGQVVAVATKVDGDVVKVPAIVTALYKNAHGEVVADLHKLEASFKAILTEDNPAEALPEGGPVVTADLSPPAEPDPSVKAAEGQFGSLTETERADFGRWLAEQVPPTT
jgi:hypothetical protein